MSDMYEFMKSFGILIAYFVVGASVSVVLKKAFKMPSELVRKTHHIIIVLSVFLLINLFQTWYLAILAILIFIGLVYPALAILEKFPAFGHIFIQRESGEIKKSLLIVHLMFILLIAIFWGWLGVERNYIIIVAVMAWGFGDAAAALIGKAYGRHRIESPLVEGSKTFEGTLAMFVTSALAMFLALILTSGFSWHLCLILAVLVAPICAFVEAVSHNGFDTLTVPFSAAISMALLVYIVSRAGKYIS